MQQPPVPRTAAFFDLDKTIIATSSTLAFRRPFYSEGLINRRSLIESAYAALMFSTGGADHAQMERLRRRLSALVAGWDVAQVGEIVAETLHELLDPLIYDEAANLLEEHRAAGRDLVIISSSGAEVVEPIGRLLGVDTVIATRMVVADGRYTGAIEFYAYGANKALALAELAEANGYDLASSYAYSDSITDVPMLSAVGHPFAVNPDRALRRVAAARGWPVLVFTRPVRLRDRMPTVPLPAAPALAAALSASAATAGLWWYAARRRTRLSA